MVRGVARRCHRDLIVDRGAGPVGEAGDRGQRRVTEHAPGWDAFVLGGEARGGELPPAPRVKRLVQGSPRAAPYFLSRVAPPAEDGLLALRRARRRRGLGDALP